MLVTKITAVAIVVVVAAIIIILIFVIIIAIKFRSPRSDSPEGRCTALHRLPPCWGSGSHARSSEAWRRVGHLCASKSEAQCSFCGQIKYSASIYVILCYIMIDSSRIWVYVIFYDLADLAQTSERNGFDRGPLLDRLHPVPPSGTDRAPVQAARFRGAMPRVAK